MRCSPRPSRAVQPAWSDELCAMTTLRITHHASRAEHADRSLTPHGAPVLADAAADAQVLADAGQEELAALDRDALEHTWPQALQP